MTNLTRPSRPAASRFFGRLEFSRATRKPRGFWPEAAFLKPPKILIFAGDTGASIGADFSRPEQTDVLKDVAAFPGG